MSLKTLKKPVVKAAKTVKTQVFAVVNYKGGVGKSTISAHLSAHLKAVVIDLDQNGDSARFGEAYGLEVHRLFGAGPEKLYDLVERLREEGRVVVVDCPPGESPLTKIALLCADVVVTPSRPGPYDLFSLGRVAIAVREATQARGQVPLLYVCNFYRNTEVSKIFEGTLMASPDGRYIGKVWERKEYAECIRVNKPVWEFAPKSTGAQEMLNLVTFLAKAGEQMRVEAANA